jgi:probable phosphoglycerate mutase
MTTLIIARHGNTFGPHDTVTYVGGRTDLPLVESGIEQAKKLGAYLKDNRLIPDVVYASSLQRTIQTATIAIKESGVTNPVFSLDIFNEIDYGPDENKTREDIIARIGEAALKNWDENGIIPDGWLANTETIIQNWIGFGEQAAAHDDNETILVVTSNGIARFAPYITGDYDTFRKNYTAKLATGSISIFKHYVKGWHLEEWNIKL